MEIMDSIYNIIVENKEDFYIDFEGNDENKFNYINPDELLIRERYKIFCTI